MNKFNKFIVVVVNKQFQQQQTSDKHNKKLSSVND